MRLLCFAGALALIAAIVGVPTHAQQRAQIQPPTFGVGIEVINLNVSVTDSRNRYVTNLDMEDFSVFEDGVRQQLTLFTHDNLPISMVVMIDTSASMDKSIESARNAAIRFVSTLREFDFAQIVQFNDRATVLQPFTADHALLETAINRSETRGPTALHNALYVSLKDLQKQKRAGELRRRAVVLLTDGEDTASLVTDEQVLDLAKKSEINIYAISLRAARLQARDRLSFSQAAHLLTSLSRETGGQVHFPNSISELDFVYDRIAEELRTQYSLGYQSANGRRDGKWRRIVVRTPAKENLQIRHKLGYYAPRS